MARIIWTESALQDLTGIAEYVSVSNLQAAKQLVQNVFNKVQRLEAFPESGKVPEEIATLHYREIVVSPCRVFYKIDQDAVYILHVLRQERDLRMFLISAGR